MRKLQVRILDERIRSMLPHYATPGAAGLDLRACMDAPLTLAGGESQLVSSGIAIHVADPGSAAGVPARPRRRSRLCGGGAAALGPRRQERHRARQSGGADRLRLPGAADDLGVE